MNYYEFTLTFRLKDHKESPEKYIGNLGVAGCDDAIVGIGKQGSIALSFKRESQSELEAITTASRSVSGAIPGAILVKTDPDILGIT